jgi:rod shape-determining protein MreD
MRIVKEHGRKIMVYAIYLVLIAILQSVIGANYVPYRFMPDLSLVFVIVCGYFFGRDDGMIIGLLAGFIRDMLAGRVLGLGMLLFMFSGIIAASFMINLFQRNILFALVQVALISMFYEITIVLITYLFPMLPDQIYSIRQLAEIQMRTFPSRLLSNILSAIPVMLALYFAGPYPRNQKRTGLEENDTGEHVWRMT